MPLSLDGGYFAHLSAFVAAGGTLIAEACPGRWDKYGWTTLNQMIDAGEELFGAKHGELVMVKEPGAASRWMPKERRFGEFDPPTKVKGVGGFAGSNARANFYLQTLRPTTAEAILTNGDEIVGVMNRYGAGQSILIGTFLGFSALAYRHADGDTDRFLELVLTGTGVKPERCGSLLRRRRMLHDIEAWFFVNLRAEPVTETIDVTGYRVAADLLGDCLTESRETDITITVAGANLACLLLSPMRETSPSAEPSDLSR